MNSGQIADKEVHRSAALAGLLKFTIVIMVLLVATGTHPYGPTTVLVGLGAWSLCGTRQAIQSLTLAVLIKTLNTSIYQFAGPFELVSWLVLALAGARILFDNLRIRSGRHLVLPWLWLFASAVLIQSLLVSEYSVISIFKLSAFTYTALIMLVGFKVTALQKIDWEPWFCGVWLAIIVLSLPTLLFPSIGYQVNGTGFQGILSHPQSFAVFLAPAAAWFTGTVALSRGRGKTWYLFALPLVWGLLYLSQARTAFVAVFGALLAVFMFAIWSRPGWWRSIVTALTRPVNIIIALVLLTAVVWQFSLVYENALNFIFKGEEATTIERSFQSSRGGLIAQEWEDFKENPILGIGFGISHDRLFQPSFDPVFGLPISAPVEKGFLPTAVLQEIGIFGTVFFVMFLFSLMRQALANSLITLPWVFMTCLFVNVGEMIFFSPNGLGLYIWLLMGWTTNSRLEDQLGS